MRLIVAGRYGNVLQSEKLAEAIRKRVRDTDTVIVLASSAGCTIETATIVGARFGVTPERCELLLREEYDDGDDQMRAILEVAWDSDVVVAITHCEAPSGIIDAFSQKWFGRESIGCRESAKGTALCLSLETADLVALP